MLTYIGLAIPLIVVPVFLLMPRGRKREPERPLSPPARRLQRIISLCVAAGLVLVAALAVTWAIDVPGRDGPIVRLALDPADHSIDTPESRPDHPARHAQNGPVGVLRRSDQRKISPGSA